MVGPAEGVEIKRSTFGDSLAGKCRLYFEQHSFEKHSGALLRAALRDTTSSRHSGALTGGGEWKLYLGGTEASNFDTYT